jgi:hypothetical protein
VLRDGRLEAVLYVAAVPVLPSIEWLKTCFDLPLIEGGLRRSLLAGRPVGGADEGPVVCACFQVGRKRVEAAIAGGACSAVRGRARDAGRHQLRLLPARDQDASRGHAAGTARGCGVDTMREVPPIETRPREWASGRAAGVLRSQGAPRGSRWRR